MKKITFIIILLVIPVLSFQQTTDYTPKSLNEAYEKLGKALAKASEYKAKKLIERFKDSVIGSTISFYIRTRNLNFDEEKQITYGEGFPIDVNTYKTIGDIKFEYFHKTDQLVMEANTDDIYFFKGRIKEFEWGYDGCDEIITTKIEIISFKKYEK